MMSIVHRSWSHLPPFKETLWLFCLSVIPIFTLLPFSGYTISSPFIVNEWQISNTQSGFVFSTYLIGYAASSLILVPLTDRLPTEKLMIFGIITTIVSNILFALFADGMWSASGLRFLMGIGNVATYIPGIRLVSSRFTGEHRGKAIGLFVGAAYAGTTLSYIFMGMLLGHTDSWKTAYLIVSLISSLSIFLSWVLIYSPPSKHLNGKSTMRMSGYLDLSTLLDKSLALAILSYALHTAELYLARMWLPLLLAAVFVQQGLSTLDATSTAAATSGIIFMMGIIGVLLGGVLSDYIGRTIAAASIFTVSGICSFILGWIIHAPIDLIIVIGFIYGFMTAADSAIHSTAIVELSPHDKIGSSQALQSFIGFTIGSIAPIFAGYLLDISNEFWEWGLTFSFNGVLAIIGVSLLLWLRHTPKAKKMANGKR